MAERKPKWQRSAHVYTGLTLKGYGLWWPEKDLHAQETALSSDRVHFYRLPLHLILYLIELSSFHTLGLKFITRKQIN